VYQAALKRFSGGERTKGVLDQGKLANSSAASQMS
jgi:hypothetical protein